MTGTALKPYKVTLHRRGGRASGRIDVQACSAQHAERVAVAQVIAVSYPDSKPSNWIVTNVEARAS
jgi:hypothetical protein